MKYIILIYNIMASITIQRYFSEIKKNFQEEIDKLSMNSCMRFFNKYGYIYCNDLCVEIRNYDIKRSNYIPPRIKINNTSDIMLVITEILSLALKCSIVHAIMIDEVDFNKNMSKILENASDEIDIYRKRRYHGIILSVMDFAGIYFYNEPKLYEENYVSKIKQHIEYIVSKLAEDIRIMCNMIIRNIYKKSKGTKGFVLKTHSKNKQNKLKPIIPILLRQTIHPQYDVKKDIFEMLFCEEKISYKFYKEKIMTFDGYLSCIIAPIQVFKILPNQCPSSFSLSPY